MLKYARRCQRAVRTEHSHQPSHPNLPTCPPTTPKPCPPEQGLVHSYHGIVRPLAGGHHGLQQTSAVLHHPHVHRPAARCCLLQPHQHVGRGEAAGRGDRQAGRQSLARRANPAKQWLSRTALQVCAAHQQGTVQDCAGAFTCFRWDRTAPPASPRSDSTHPAPLPPAAPRCPRRCCWSLPPHRHRPTAAARPL